MKIIIIRSGDHNIYTETDYKVALSSEDDKRIILDGILLSLRVILNFHCGTYSPICTDKSL